MRSRGRPTSEMSRREFAETLALAALAPVLGTEAGALRWTPLDPGGSSSACAALAGQAPGPLARALAGVIRVQYGKRLSDEALATVTRQIESGLERADEIRKAALSNGDEPDFIFSAVRTADVA